MYWVTMFPKKVVSIGVVRIGKLQQQQHKARRDLIKHVIIDIVQHNTMAHKGRDDDVLKTITSFDDLKSAISNRGIETARSLLY